MVSFLDPECETMTRGSPYKFAMLNNPQNSHLGKLGLSPTWRIQFCSNLWGWKEDISSYLNAKFQTVRSRNFGDTAESISDNSTEEIGETRASCFERFPPLFSEKEYIGQLTLKRNIFLANQNFEIPSLKNKVFFPDKP